MSNAIKFTEKGKIDVLVASTQLESHPNCTTLTFTISDTGIGMDSEHLLRVFEPFTQADSSITRRYGGTGLGLSIVNRLLELMGSSLDVVSTLGQGSTFTFKLEFGFLPEQIHCTLKTPEEIKKMRVLVIDDSADSCQMLESMLADLSYMSTSVTSGAAALEELERVAISSGETPYRLILLDWRMPDMDGLETARRIRNGDTSPRPEIIIISGYITADIEDAGHDLGIKIFLNKPFNLTSLFNGILATFDIKQPLITQQKKPVYPAGDKLIQLRDAKVLLVEDDKVNQIVAREIMTRLGAVVTTVDNGKSGVEAALGSSDFDMVFMDIQMPEMNGYEAATAIRQVKGELELPIIAMTAHAFNEERDRCFASGMNDHIAKPIDPDKLYSVILKWLSPEKVKNVSPTQQILGIGSQSMILPNSLPGIDFASVVRRCSGNESLAKEIIITFRDQNRTTLNELRSAIEGGNSEHAKALVHNLKGLAGTVGAASMAITASELETALQHENWEAGVNVSVILEQQLAELFEAADVLDSVRIDQLPDPAWVQLSNEELEPLLKKLYDALHKNSLGAKKLFEQIKVHLRSSERNEIYSYMNRLDFEMALAALERAAQSLGISLQSKV